MRSAKVKALGERGDTIVEVMIVLAILSFAIIIAYSSANRSLADARQSEENSYAAELAQSQVEQIRSAVINSNDTSTGSISNLNAQEMSGASFCMSAGSAITTTAAAFLSPNPCIPTNTTGGVPYTLADTLSQPVQSLPALDSFQILVTWPDALGQGEDTLTLFYQAVPPQ